MSKSIAKLVTNLTTPIAINAGSNISFNNIVSTDKCISLNNGTSIELLKEGIYKVNMYAIYVATTTDDIQINLLANGNIVAGATAISTPSAIGDYVTLPLATVLTVSKGSCGSYATLNLNNISESTIQIANLIIEKVC